MPLQGMDKVMASSGWAKSFVHVECAFDRPILNLGDILRNNLCSLLSNPSHILRMQLVRPDEPSTYTISTEPASVLVDRILQSDTMSPALLPDNALFSTVLSEWFATLMPAQDCARIIYCSLKGRFVCCFSHCFLDGGRAWVDVVRPMMDIDGHPADSVKLPSLTIPLTYTPVVSELKVAFSLARVFSKLQPKRSLRVTEDSWTGFAVMNTLLEKTKRLRIRSGTSFLASLTAIAAHAVFLSMPQDAIPLHLWFGLLVSFSPTTNRTCFNNHGIIPVRVPLPHAYSCDALIETSRDVERQVSASRAMAFATWLATNIHSCGTALTNYANLDVLLTAAPLSTSGSAFNLGGTTARLIGIRNSMWCTLPLYMGVLSTGCTQSHVSLNGNAADIQCTELIHKLKYVCDFDI
tara:strand:+ start:3635 stop:4858 length:1224 start_codon:yes stop_codon:yes gene_type:complete